MNANAGGVTFPQSIWGKVAPSRFGALASVRVVRASAQRWDLEIALGADTRRISYAEVGVLRISAAAMGACLALFGSADDVDDAIDACEARIRAERDAFDF